MDEDRQHNWSNVNDIKKLQNIKMLSYIIPWYTLNSFKYFKSPPLKSMYSVVPAWDYDEWKQCCNSWPSSQRSCVGTDSAIPATSLENISEKLKFQHWCQSKDASLLWSAEKGCIITGRWEVEFNETSRTGVQQKGCVYHILVYDIIREKSCDNLLPS